MIYCKNTKRINLMLILWYQHTNKFNSPKASEIEMSLHSNHEFLMDNTEIDSDNATTAYSPLCVF